MAQISIFSICEIDSAITQVLDRLNYGQQKNEEALDLRLCMHEMLSNALVHGHANAEVCLNYELDKNTLCIRVFEVDSTWQGEEIDQSSRCLDEKIYEEHGRGLFLVKSLAQSFGYCENCKGVRATFLLTGGSDGKEQ